MYVKEKAVVGRINRKLTQQGQALRKSRSTQMQIQVGDFYIVDVYGNYIADQHVDIKELGRELGVLRPDEELAGTEECFGPE